MRKLFPLLVCFVCGLLIVLSFGLWRQQGRAQSTLMPPVLRTPNPEMRVLEKRPLPFSENVSVPDSIKICIFPYEERFDLWGTMQKEGKTYYSNPT